jgi:biopolymer transport protein ExbB
MKGARLHAGWLAVFCLLLTGVGGLAQAPAPAPAAAAEVKKEAGAKKDTAAKKEAEIKIDDIEDIANIEADALSEQMEELEEGDHREFKVLTDDNIATLAVGDIYRSGPTFFKVKVIAKQSDKGGTFVMERIRGRLDPTGKWDRMSGEGPLTVTTRQTLLDRFVSGGIFMYPIAFLLLVGLIVTIRCLFYFREALHCPRPFAEACGKAIEQGDLAKFEELALKQKGLLGHACRVMAANMRRLTIEELKSRIEAEAVTEVGRLAFLLRVLNFVTVASPLFGLLGTVQGLIMCFESLAGETATQSKAVALAAGIKVALLTTAFGLIVALPILMAFFVFNHRLNHIANLCGVTTEEMLHELAILRRETVPSEVARVEGARK